MREGDQMRLYTSTGTRKTVEKCNALNIGLLMVDVWRDPTKWPSFAIDNGCFAAYHRNERWNPAPFLKLLHKCHESGYKPDFVVIPDIPLSKDSKDFSSYWLPVLGYMYPTFPLYLAVQDGMK